jgi:DNA-binding transcriptional ArsR family regulator
MNATFKALNDATRRNILELLKSGDMTAGDIADKFEFSKPTISHHLDLLWQAGLIERVKRGQFVYYSLNATVMDEVVKWFLQFNDTRKRKPKK